MKYDKQRSVRLIILFTSNNILYSVVNIKGSTLFSTSMGSTKIKGTKKVTLTTISSSIRLAAHFINKLKIKYIYLELKGLHKNKKIVLRYLKQFSILAVINSSPIGHNGCKNPKIRRI